MDVLWTGAPWLNVEGAPFRMRPNGSRSIRAHFFTIEEQPLYF
jgi:hypothetical protein